MFSYKVYNIHQVVLKSVSYIHLLDGSTDLDKLWEDREERFNQNCVVADNIQEKLDNECKKQILERLDEYCIPYNNRDKYFNLVQK